MWRWPKWDTRKAYLFALRGLRVFFQNLLCFFIRRTDNRVWASTLKIPGKKETTLSHFTANATLTADAESRTCNEWTQRFHPKRSNISNKIAYFDAYVMKPVSSLFHTRFSFHRLRRLSAHRMPYKRGLIYAHTSVRIQWNTCLCDDVPVPDCLFWNRRRGHPIDNGISIYSWQLIAFNIDIYIIRSSEHSSSGVCVFWAFSKLL